MKELFIEHYIDVPEGKDDLVTVAEAKVAELQAELNEAIDKNISLKKEINTSKRENVIKEETKDLTDTQKEKFASLVEGIDSSDIETFKGKVKTIRESFFKKEKSDDIIEEETKEIPDRMKLYASFL